MAPNCFCFILFLALFDFVGANQSVESGCARKDALVEREGRLCAAPCTRQRTCRSPERECRCDGVCGRTCVIRGLECPELRELDNGFVVVNERLLGARASYSCDRGFKLVGLAERVCQGDGSWSGEEPTCLEEVRCFISTLPRFDGVLYQKEILPWYLNGETVGFICSSRYQLTSGHLKGYIECLEGQWLLPKFTCEPRSCPPFLSTDPTLVIESNNVIKHSESIALSCYHDYSLHGSSVITCQFGTWLMPNGRTYCGNKEYEDESDTSDRNVPGRVDDYYDYKDVINPEPPEIPTTPEPEIDDGVTVPIVEWTVDNGGAIMSEGKLYVHENSDLHLVCKWSLSGNPLWVFTQSRETENYKLEWDKADRTSSLTVWSVQEDDSGIYSCLSPLEKQENNLFVTVLRQPSDGENQTVNYEFSPPTLYSCIFHRSMNTIASYGGQFLHDGDYVPDKGTVRIFCREIGQFLLVGSESVTCIEGAWIPISETTCVRLKRNSESQPPPIEILSQYVFLNDGSIAVDPKQSIELHCLWVMPPEPQDTWYHATWYRSDDKGNLVLPAEIIPIKRKHGDNQIYSYRLTVNAVEDSVTTFTCLTPENESNSVRIRFTRACKFAESSVPLDVILEDSNLKPFYLPGEQINVKGCKNNKRLIGLNYIKCLSTGVWSEPLLYCRQQ